ncbi:hypothetical protein M9H77_02977 [Catharanthus roseus]|uniref:Uncharacterized protein n=1 Tax=Catharanthus roseus TaxID=4058 RepID=A0ACC0CAC9_CATRO|nr:hypothetical protein M9H77_02977 [Catharanthus roseus]
MVLVQLTNYGVHVQNVDNDETSRIDIDVQDIGTLVHESSELESVQIRRRNSIGDEDDNNEDEEEMVCGSKKKRAHSETCTPASASIPPRTSTPTSASIPMGTSTYPAMTSTPLVTLILFPQLPYSSSTPISTPSSSSAELKANAKCLHIETGSPCLLTSILAHNLQPSPLSDGEATVARHRFCGYLLWLSTMSASRGRRGFRPLHNLIHLSVYCVARFGIYYVPFFPSNG